MDNDQYVGLILKCLSIIGSAITACIWLFNRAQIQIAKAKERSVGAAAMFDIMKELNKVQLDIQNIEHATERLTEKSQYIKDDSNEMNLEIENLKNQLRQDMTELRRDMQNLNLVIMQLNNPNQNYLKK